MCDENLVTGLKELKEELALLTDAYINDTTGQNRVRIETGLLELGEELSQMLYIVDGK